MLIQLVCLLLYFISHDVTLDSCANDWIIRKTILQRTFCDLKRTINKQNWAGLDVIWKIKQAWSLGQITANIVSMCLGYIVFKWNI